MKTSILITILGIFAATLNAQADINKSESYDSFTVDTSDQKPFSVVLSAETQNCGIVELKGEMRPAVPGADPEEQIILMDYSLTGTFGVCNPFVPQKQQTAKIGPLKIQPLKDATQVKLIVPAGYQVELAQ